MVALLDKIDPIAPEEVYPDEFETEAGLETFEVTDDVIEELRRGEQMQRIMALNRQSLAARLQSERYTLDHGEVDMQVDPYFFHYWGQRLGYDCWNDKQFCDEFKRDNPEVRVKSRSKKISVGYIPTKSKYHKSYAWKDSPA